uniref:Uncharacterized protein n=1 Tax=Picea sitchensis TaxID=3332 RepID=B8LMQ5_PICSI|nr:unknown [Picea sitchensis]
MIQSFLVPMRSRFSVLQVCRLAILLHLIHFVRL